MNHTDAIETMLKNLDDWRHLPKYQLERRADMFFGLFVRKIVSEHLKVDIHPVIIPEFPYRIRTTNHTVNFDYVLFDSDVTKAYVVELKTEPDSASPGNNDYLDDLYNDNFANIISSLKSVMKATDQKSKYAHLLNKLSLLGISVDDPCCSNDSKEWICLRKSGNETIKIEIIYLAPKLKKPLNVNFNHILFTDAVKILEDSGGAVECHFASYLRRWNDIKAGNVNG